MREVDRVAIEETGPNLWQMMENAGRHLAQTVLAGLAPDANGPVVVLAGTGGNGGGGIAAARHLANRGVSVQVVLRDARLGEVPAFQLHVLRATPARLVPLAQLADTQPAAVVDAVIGYSLRGAPEGSAAEMIAWATGTSAPVIALDVPSGVDATTGEAPGRHVVATTTLTLALPKHGLAAPATGALLLADIGIPPATFQRAGVDLRTSPFASRDRVALHRVTRRSQDTVRGR